MAQQKLDYRQLKSMTTIGNEREKPMELYISGRQFGKTTMLIKESARTGATIAVANYRMAEYVNFRAKQMGLEIPQPVTYAEVFKSYWHNKSTRYLVDELQMMLSQLNIDIATMDTRPVRYLNHWKYPDGYQPRLVMCDENPISMQREAIMKIMNENLISDALSESLKGLRSKEVKGE